MPDARTCRRTAWWLTAILALVTVAALPAFATPPILEGPDLPGPTIPISPETFGPVAPPAPYVTVVNNGPSSNRVDIVFLGDGYTSTQIDSTYTTHVQNAVSYILNQSQEPFARYHNFFNVHRVNVVSNQSGADVPPLGIYRDTALDASYYYDGVTDRLLYVNTSKATTALNNGLAGSGITADIKFVTVNDTRYGGGGGSMAVYAGGNSLATEIALHEVGHSFGNLADEYAYTTQTYTGGEPYSPNTTKSPTGAKWSRWLGYVDPAHPELGAIGAFEGAGYYTNGLYRPSANSKMRSLNRPFDAVGREALILAIYGYVDPLDTWLATGGTLTDPASLWVDTVDPSVINVDWFVNGQSVGVDAGETFRLQDYGFGAGTYSVRSHAYDGTGWVRLDSNLVWQDVTWNVVLTPEPATLALVTFGALVLLRRRRAAQE